MNEKRIQQVLEIEKQANAVHDAAVSEAAQLPVQAEKEAQEILDKARAAAEEEARKMLATAHAEEESADILAQADQNVQRIETLALGNLNRAVAYVLNRVVGRG